MSYVPEMAQLRGLPYETAKLYGMPHIGACYARDDVDATRFTGERCRCACCGAGWGPHSKHHEPPKGRGRVFLLCTEWGRFVLKPALIDLCGSGTTGCHGDRHNGRLKIRWEWDDDGAEERWWSGWWLSHGIAPHSRGLFKHGRYVFERGGREWEVRL